ncbi:ATP-binding cassette domain-containing protein [Mycoplasma sp. 2704]|uniref:ATP-binding cassette domain-containing protein n=1 Tax=Mycoplasma sp. 2704 TaxID=3108529 RepID=UPI002B1CFFE5|nr:ATP-binding cassette domain-containing protein [Mycoplasma sp. 2704]MEA4134693.1 ATP-binding cassette domain-containing protein [Mycoplasma sp. 2704]
MIKFKDVVIKYKDNGNFDLKDLNFTIPKGQLVGLIGKSGAGKSTILKSFYDLDTIANGSVIVDDLDIKNLTKNQKRKYKNQIEYVDPDGLNLINYSTFDNLKFNYKHYKNFIYKFFKFIDKQTRDKIWNLAERLQISNLLLAPINKLSSGQKQRAQLLISLINEPQILLGDELTSNLDNQNSHNVMKLLKEFSKDRYTIIAIHDLNLAIQYCDKLISLKRGKVDKVFIKDEFDKKQIESYFDEPNQVNKISK